ncbi:MAG: helix-turn-helix transcriptional regulator [Candidatus Gastranaerophilales bacterium]|nr:helix-turn-helix transcriptional regulator [Candidatus Gastranaerophilales bacterium]
MSSVREIFAYNIRRIRNERDLTQEEFAELLDTTLKTISDLENRKYLPKPVNLDKMCEKLNIAVGDFFQLPIEEVDDVKSEKIKQINKTLLSINVEHIDMIQQIIETIVQELYK